MIAMKFGGTSVGNVEAFAQVVRIVATAVDEQARTDRPGVVVVTSAMSGVTNLLIEAAQLAADGDEQFYHEAENTLRVKHQFVAGQLIDDVKLHSGAVTRRFGKSTRPRAADRDDQRITGSFGLEKAKQVEIELAFEPLHAGVPGELVKDQAAVLHPEINNRTVVFLHPAHIRCC